MNRYVYKGSNLHTDDNTDFCSQVSDESVQKKGMNNKMRFHENRWMKRSYRA